MFRKVKIAWIRIGIYSEKVRLSLGEYLMPKSSLKLKKRSKSRSNRPAGGSVRADQASVREWLRIKCAE